eukprot:CAMPEP_0175807522 /NCGR_PEP_ID=MMETSP0107_2-20121207/1764_1 /TAXON_ID=195067 ORGANISM="Goniomonas pacifica, Strain CCMP1869" /NCGR_SAMPLE_ID=MMETSP0107_2 /ASSEMBLY_ACC=CAM_ASM_000203 /LENGTH=53 /DNA_ID=CAMNT_0017119075 /DNA_START=199 /DNA_END=360 /DNA_ORIENTATION=-
MTANRSKMLTTNLMSALDGRAALAASIDTTSLQVGTRPETASRQAAFAGFSRP